MLVIFSNDFVFYNNCLADDDHLSYNSIEPNNEDVISQKKRPNLVLDSEDNSQKSARREKENTNVHDEEESPLRQKIQKNRIDNCIDDGEVISFSDNKEDKRNESFAKQKKMKDRKKDRKKVQREEKYLSSSVCSDNN